MHYTKSQINKTILYELEEAFVVFFFNCFHISHYKSKTGSTKNNRSLITGRTFFPQ